MSNHSNDFIIPVSRYLLPSNGKAAFSNWGIVLAEYLVQYRELRRFGLYAQTPRKCYFHQENPRCRAQKPHHTLSSVLKTLTHSISTMYLFYYYRFGTKKSQTSTKRLTNYAKIKCVSFLLINFSSLPLNCICQHLWKAPCIDDHSNSNNTWCSALGSRRWAKPWCNSPAILFLCLESQMRDWEFLWESNK